MEGIRRSDRKSAEPVSKEDARARIANLRDAGQQTGDDRLITVDVVSGLRP